MSNNPWRGFCNLSPQFINRTHKFLNCSLGLTNRVHRLINHTHQFPISAISYKSDFVKHVHRAENISERHTAPLHSHALILRDTSQSIPQSV